MNRFSSEDICPEKYSEVREKRMKHNMRKKYESEDDENEDEPDDSNLILILRI